MRILFSPTTQQYGFRDFVSQSGSWLSAVLLVCTSTTAYGETEIHNDQATLGASGAALLISPPPIEGVVGDISITNRNIFDLTDPAEGGALYRFANRIHIKTRADVIEQQLLLQTGDAFSPQAAAESERILRANRYIHDASVTPVLRADGVVDLARQGIVLAPGGIYRAELRTADGIRARVFEIDAFAVPGLAPIVSRLLRM